MIQLLVGKKGSGKTKTLIENVNSSASVADGNIVFISNDTKRHIYDISHKVRMVDTSEFQIKYFASFYGFLCGLISQDYDISTIYIDSLTKICNDEISFIEKFMESLEKLSADFHVSFFITVSKDIEELPEGIKKYI
jgi:hypothetical protein